MQIDQNDSNCKSSECETFRGGYELGYAQARKEFRTTEVIDRQVYKWGGRLFGILIVLLAGAALVIDLWWKPLHGCS